MSLIHAHIRAFRAKADALDRVADIELSEEGQRVLRCLAQANRFAADSLEAEEADKKPPREGSDAPINYNPRGRPSGGAT